MFSVLLITANRPEPVVLNIMLSSVLLSVVCVCVCVSCNFVFVFDFSLLSFQLVILSLRVCTCLTNSA